MALQLAIFWIATSWLGRALCWPGGERARATVSAPRGERTFRRADLVVGGVAGQRMDGIQQRLASLFWFGTKGYEYVDLAGSGRYCCYRRAVACD